MKVFGFWNKAKRERKEDFEQQKQATQKIVKTGESLEQNAKEAITQIVKSGGSLEQQAEKLVGLVVETERTKAALLEKENTLQKKEDDANNRIAYVRQQEIDITARTSDVRKKESEVNRLDESLDKERKDIKKRERIAKKLTDTAKAEKEKFEGREQKIEQQENDLSVRINEFESREENAKATFKKAEALEAELSGRREALEQEYADIQKSLNEKIAEYDRKIAAIEEAGNLAEAIKFDASKEGKEAKIVVADAIKQAKKHLTDVVNKFDELHEKYCGGTFRGFSMPIDLIDKNFQTLKAYTKQIQEHVEANEFMRPLAEKIETHLLDADLCMKKWDYSESYRHICFGLAVCEVYELTLEIFSGDSEDSDEEDEIPDYYEILGVSEKASEKDIKAAFRKLASKYHTDRTSKETEETKKKYEEKMKEINIAYDILGDKEKRKKYDEQRNKHKGK